MWQTLKSTIKESFKLTKGTFLVFTVLNPVIQLLMLTGPYVTKLLLDTLTAYLSGKITFEAAFQKVLMYTFFQLAFYLLYSLLDNYYEYIYQTWYNKYLQKQRIHSADYVKDLPVPFFESEAVGRIQEKIGAGANAKIGILMTIFVDIVPEIITTIVVLIILIRVDPVLTLIGLSGLPFFILFRYLMFKKVKKPMKASRKITEDYSASENEFYHNIKIIKAFNRSEYKLGGLKKLSNRYYESEKSISKTRSKYNFVSYMLTNLPENFVTFFAAIRVISGQISIGDLILFRNYLFKIYGPIWRISRNLNQMEKNLITAKRMDEILGTEQELTENDYKKTSFKGSIIFKNVAYHYDKDKKVLNNLNFAIDEGSVVAFVGPSGVGKSTIIKLLLRFIEPEKGAVYIGKTKLSDIPKLTLREKLGLVFQDSLLFNDTVSNNIKFGRLNATDKEMMQAAEKANAKEFIEKLPKKFKTIVGERGVKLSGGEQQRINLSRAILKNPNILILDEATSSLDSESEKLIQDALWKFVEGRTTIIIAHRLATVMRADKIIVLDKGGVAEEGTHMELLEKNGLYAKLFKLQSGALLLAEDDQDSTLEDEEVKEKAKA